MAAPNRSGGIVTTGMPGVAPADPADALDRAPKSAVLFHRLGKITAAGGLKTAVPSQERTQQQAIRGDEPEECRDRQAIDRGGQPTEEFGKTTCHLSHHPRLEETAACHLDAAPQLARRFSPADQFS